MKITKLGNSFTIENEGNITQHAVGSLSAYIGQSRDSITIKNAGENLGSAPITAITVNDVQMTSDNIEELLSNLFTTNTGNDSIAASSDLAYTKAEYSDPLVFPTPTRAGHITEFYKDNTLYQAYQWNGWDWIMLGAEPNFIFTQLPNQNSVLGDNISYSSKIGNTVKLFFEKGADYTNTQIYASSIERSNTDYKLGSVNIIMNSDDRNLTISDLNADTFQVGNTSMIFNDRLTLNNCICTNFNPSAIFNQILMDKFISTEGALFLRSSALSITNSTFNYLVSECILSDQTQEVESTINISNNSLNGTDDNASIQIGVYSSNGLERDYNLIVKENKGLKSFSLGSFNNGLKVASVDMSFDEYLEEVQVFSSDFTQDAFDSFINSLITATEANSSRNLSLQDVTPTIKNEQKVALISAGWKVL